MIQNSTDENKKQRPERRRVNKFFFGSIRLIWRSEIDLIAEIKKTSLW
jgi:hypothetical protein